MAPKIAIVYYSTWGHILQLAEAEAEGIKRAGGEATIYQLPETLPQEVLTKMYAAPKSDKYPVLSDPTTLTQYDGVLMGVPTRFGNFPAQWKTFWDSTGSIWQSGGFAGKYFGMFVSSAALGGGQESTNIAAMSTMAHHGIIFVPLGASGAAGPILANLDEVRGGSAWGAGTFAGGHGQRQPSKNELELARIQGETFYQRLSRVSF